MVEQDAPPIRLPPRCRMKPYWNRVGGGVAPPPLTHHRTCGSASGGSSGRWVETLPGLAQGLQAKVVPVGVGQGYLEDLGACNPPVSPADTGPFPGLAFGDAAYSQVVPLAGGGLPFLPADLPQAAAQPSVQLAEHADALSEPEVGYPAPVLRGPATRR